MEFYNGLAQDLRLQARQLKAVRTNTNHRPAIFLNCWSDEIPEGGAEIELEEGQNIRKKAWMFAEKIRQAESLVVLTGRMLARQGEGFGIEEDVRWDDPSTLAHRVLAAMVRVNIVKHIVTTDTTGAHVLSGIPPDKLSEVHGNVLKEICPYCGAAYYRKQDIFTEGDCARSLCINCKKKLLSSCTGRHQSLVETEMKQAYKLLESCDLCLVVGNSLRSGPISNRAFHTNGLTAKFTAIVNTHSTAYDDICDLHVAADADVFFHHLADHLELTIDASSPEFEEFIVHRQVLPWMVEEEFMDEISGAQNPIFDSNEHSADDNMTHIRNNYQQCQQMIRRLEAGIADIAIFSPEQFDPCSQNMAHLRELEGCLDAMFSCAMEGFLDMQGMMNNMNMSRRGIDTWDDGFVAKQISMMQQFSKPEQKNANSDDIDISDSPPIDPVLINLGPLPMHKSASIQQIEREFAATEGDQIRSDDCDCITVLGPVPGQKSPSYNTGEYDWDWSDSDELMDKNTGAVTPGFVEEMV